MTKQGRGATSLAVRLPFSTEWRADRAVVAAAHQHVTTPKAGRPVTPSSLVGLSHNLLAQRTQSPRNAGPPKWRSASPRQARPEGAAVRPPSAAAARPRMAAATPFAEAVAADDFFSDEGDLSLPQVSLQEEAAGPEAGGKARTRRPSSMAELDGRASALSREVHLVGVRVRVEGSVTLTLSYPNPK